MRPSRSTPYATPSLARWRSSSCRSALTTAACATRRCSRERGPPFHLDVGAVLSDLLETEPAVEGARTIEPFDVDRHRLARSLRLAQHVAKEVGADLAA